MRARQNVRMSDAPEQYATEQYAVEYRDWIIARDRAAWGPAGLAALASMAWLDATPRAHEGIPGTWAATGSDPAGGVAVGTLDGESIALAPGEEARHGTLTLRAFARDGEIAIRVLDPARATGPAAGAIDRYAYDAALRVPGTFEERATAPVETLAVDGHRSTTRYAGVVACEVGGTPVELWVHRDGGDLFAAFSDSTADPAHYAFRMLRVPAPTGSGPVTVDLNRAYLPPSRFSPHYVCVTPPPANRWTVPVRAGERGIVPSA